MNHSGDPNDGAAKREFDRRQFLRSMGVMSVAGVLAEIALFDQMASAAAEPSAPGKRPNMIVLLVDELRFPSVFPQDISTPEQFLEKFMPNTHELWRHGVKFTGHHTAGMACSPARASLVTGLYPHQQWELVTRTPRGPQLQKQFPTYGKLLRGLGYNTPYIGKWHLSNAPSDGSTTGFLEQYGFDGLSNPDPLGQNGDGASKDPGVGDQAVSWLQGKSAAQQPYCLTVGFVNPHDRQLGVRPRPPAPQAEDADMGARVHPHGVGRRLGRPARAALMASCRARSGLLIARPGTCHSSSPTRAGATSRTLTCRARS